MWSMLTQLLLKERDSLRQKPILEFLVERNHPSCFAWGRGGVLACHIHLRGMTLFLLIFTSLCLFSSSYPSSSSYFSGPVIKAEVGDILLVTFANKADKVYSILPHGVVYDKASDAAPNIDGKSQPKLR